jgi:thiol-disulfide isomerase/thioredoxin
MRGWVRESALVGRRWAAAGVLWFAGTTLAHAAGSDSLFAATLTDLDNKPAALEQYRGKPLIVNFWARWCGPCRAEIPELVKFSIEHKGKIEVLGINVEDKAEPVKDFAKAYDMSYPLVIAKDKSIPLMQTLGNSKAGLPFTVFIDRNGQVIQKKLGLVKKSDLDAAASLLLKP